MGSVRSVFGICPVISVFTAHLAGPVALKHVLVEAASLKKEEGALEKSPTAIYGHRHRLGTPRRNKSKTEYKRKLTSS